MNLDLVVDPGWGIGLLLAQVRVATFTVAAAPLSAAVPLPGRLAFVVALSLALAQPIAGDLAVPTLVAAAVVNATIGGVLGWLVGVLFQLFAVAGSLLDMSSGFSIATVYDPTLGEQGAVLSRLFQVAGLTLFHVGGGLPLLVSTLGWSVAVVPLDGALDLHGGIADAAVELTSLLVVSGFELALPVLAALFLVEVVLGLASRFAPTANVFLLGMPAKVGVAMVFGSASVALFPVFLDGLLDTTSDTLLEVLGGLAA